VEGTAQTSIEEGNQGLGVVLVSKKTTLRLCGEEPMSRSMQLYYIPVTAFSQTDLFLDRVSRE